MSNLETNEASKEIAGLADLLHETSEHHGHYEATAPKHNWWDWYAAYMYSRQHGRTPEESSEDAGHYMEQKFGRSG